MMHRRRPMVLTAYEKNTIERSIQNAVLKEFPRGVALTCSWESAKADTDDDHDAPSSYLVITYKDVGQKQGQLAQLEKMLKEHKMTGGIVETSMQFSFVGDMLYITIKQPELDALKTLLADNGYPAEISLLSSVTKVLEELKSNEQYMNNGYGNWRATWGQQVKALMVANQVLYLRDKQKESEIAKQAKLMEKLVEHIDPRKLLEIINELNAKAAETETAKPSTPLDD